MNVAFLVQFPSDFRVVTPVLWSWSAPEFRRSPPSRLTQHEPWLRLQGHVGDCRHPFCVLLLRARIRRGVRVSQARRAVLYRAVAPRRRRVLVRLSKPVAHPVAWRRTSRWSRSLRTWQKMCSGDGSARHDRASCECGRRLTSGVRPLLKIHYFHQLEAP